MRKILYILVQCSWGILQTLAGAVLFLIYRRQEHRFYKGCIVTYWPRGGGVSLGLFVFLGHGRRENRVLVHEYGHTVQSLILGPLYLLIIGLPSFTWAGLPYFQRLRREKKISYYSFYPEKWADHLGQRVTGTTIHPEGNRLLYFITNSQRKKRGTCFFEFQKGDFRDEKHWLEDSVMLDAEVFDRLGMLRIFQHAVPDFNYYGPTQVTAQEYQQLKLRGLAAGGEIAEVIRELDPWAEAALQSHGCFSILGI